MRKLIWPIAFAFAFAIPALAQQAQQEVTLKVTNDDVNVIGRALGKLPFDEVAGLVQKLRSQIVEQQPKQAPVAPEGKKE